MNRKKIIVLVFVGALVLVGLPLVVAQAWVGPAESSAPAPVEQAGMALGSISYQGRLLDSDGHPVNGSREMTFRLYTQAAGGTAIWSDMFPVQVDGGLFSVSLAVPPEIFDGRELWLGVQVGGETEMAPRQHLQPVPYALHAASIADGAVTAGKIGEPCAEGQVLARVGETWACADAGLDLSPPQRVTHTIQIQGLSLVPIQVDLLSLGMSTEVDVFVDGSGNIVKLPGTDHYADLSLVCLEPCGTLNDWYEEIRSGTTTRRAITVNLWSDDGSTVEQVWLLSDCWPHQLETVLSADGSDILAKFTFACDEIEWEIP